MVSNSEAQGAYTERKDGFSSSNSKHEDNKPRVRRASHITGYFASTRTRRPRVFLTRASNTRISRALKPTFYLTVALTQV